MKRFILFLLLVLSVSGYGQMALTLEGCRDLATTGSTQSKIDQENLLAASYNRKAAIARFFPTISANGAYAYVSRHLQLIPNETTTKLGVLGVNGITYNNPATTFIGQYLQGIGSDLAGGVYSELYNKLNLDISNIFVGQVGVIQPIWVGGRLIQAHKISKGMENLSKIQAAKNHAELIVSVDEAYWRVASVAEKKILAERYRNLLKKLLSDIETAVQEGVATQADILKVRVKLNEAEASYAQAEDGLILSKMALCQIIGLPLTTDITIDMSGLDDIALANEHFNIEDVLNKRQEMQLLDEVNKMAKAGVKLVSGNLQPNIVASANYVVTNPSCVNGFKNQFSGFFTAGVVVNIPIAHADDILMLKAAQHKAKTVELQMQEAKEKIELQATQSAQKVVEADHQLMRAKTAIEAAQQNLDYAQEAYNEGVITASDLMMAQTAWQKAYSDKIDAAIALRMAEITLKKNTGNLK